MYLILERKGLGTRDCYYLNRSIPTTLKFYTIDFLKYQNPRMFHSIQI